MNKIILILLGFCLSGKVQAQLYNNGGTISIATNGILHVGGSFTNATNGVIANNGTLNLTGNLVNNQSMSAANSGTLTFAGSSTQTVSGTDSYLAKNVSFNNAAGVTLSKSLKADGVVTFQSGIVAASSSSEPLALTSNGTVSTPSNTSHVNGYVQKEGTGAFDFPVGDGTRYQKISTNLTANGTGIVVKYNASDAGSGTFATTGASATPLVSYNTQEHWDISPLSTATGTVTIYWDDYKIPALTDVNVLKVAHKSGSNWLNEGGTGTGNTSAGSVTSSSLSTWSPFTLGQVSGCTTPTAYNVTGTGSYCAGGTGVAVGLANSETGVTYQLMNGASTVGTPVNGTGSAITFPNQTTAATYTVVATRTTGSCTATMTGSAVVTIDPLPTVYTTSGGGVYCPGGASVAVNISDTESGVEYHIYRDGNPVNAFLEGDGAPQSFNAGPDVNLPLNDIAGVYTLVATIPSTGCTANMTGSATVSVGTLPAAYTVTGTGSYCAGGTGVAVGLANSETGVTYQLMNGASTVGTPVNGTGSAITFPNQTTAATYTVVATRTTGSCTATMTGSAVVTVNNCSTLTLGTATNPLFCGASTGTISFTSSGITAGSQMLSYKLNAGATTTAPVMVAADGSFTLTGLGAGTYSDFAIGAVAATGNRSIDNSTPTLVYKSVRPVTTCGGTNGIIYLNTTNVLNGAYTLNYQKDGMAATASVVASAGDLELTNLSKGTYSNFSVTYGSCSTTYASGPIVVNDPATPTLSVTEIATITYCGGSDAQLNILPSLDLESYTLSYKKDGVDQTPISIPDVGVTINTFGAGNYTEMKITGVSTSCVSPPQSIIVSNPTPTLDISNFTEPTSCGATDGSIELSSVAIAPSNYTFTYKKNNVSQSLTLNSTTGFMLSNLGAGDYSDFAVTLSTGCATSYLGSSPLKLSDPTPIIIAGTAVNPTTCGGTNGSIPFTTDLGDGPYTLNYTKGGTAASASITVLNGEFTLSTLSTGTYTAFAITSAGCTSNDAAVKTLTNTAGPNPTVNLSVSTNAGTEAAATSITVTANASAAVSGAQTVSLGVSGTGITTGDYTLNNTTASSVTINIPDGMTTGTATFKVVDDAAVEGTETATLTISSPSSCIALGSTTTQNITITDNDVACTNPTAYNVTGTGSYCAGGTGVAVGLSGSEAGVTYQLMNGASTVGTPVNGTGSAITFPNQTTAATYTVVATRTTGSCTATMTGSAIVTVNATVTPSVSVMANPGTTITAGTSVTFTASPTNGGTTPVYQWKKNNNNVGTNSATYTDAALADNDFIKVVMTSSAACASPAAATSNDVTITVTSGCNCDPTCSPIPTAASTYPATKAVLNATSGYTHYCDASNNLLLSIKVPTGMTIPASAVKITVGATAATFYTRYCSATTAQTTCFMDRVGGSVLINRSWHIDQGLVTGGTISLTNPLSVASYFMDADYTALNTTLTNNSLTGLTNKNQLRLYQPRANLNFMPFADPSTVVPQLSVTRHSHGASPGTASWLLSTPRSTVNMAEFKVSSIKHSGGIGIH
jgi:hypothetical protein